MGRLRHGTDAAGGQVSFVCFTSLSRASYALTFCNSIELAYRRRTSSSAVSSESAGRAAELFHRDMSSPHMSATAMSTSMARDEAMPGGAISLL